MTEQKHIHFIGICGVGMGAIAVMMKKMGWQVTGSDKGFFPPISDFLKEHQIDFYPGWHPEKMNQPEIVVVGNFISLKNPEYLFSKEKNLTIKSYPEIVAQYIIKKNSIVITGTYGKTTIAAFLAHLFKKADLNPSWFVGGLAKNLDSGAENNQGNWSIVEGDEYTTARWDPYPKFFLYKPTHLILTSIVWDHLDVFPTEKKYNQVFQELIKLIPQNGQIIAAQRENDQKIDKIVSQTKAEITRYGKKGLKFSDKNYTYEINSLKKGSSEFTIYCNGKILSKFTTSLLGEHLIENLSSGIALAHNIGIDLNIIKKSVAGFQGVKRRLEIRDKVNEVKIIDDIAHSPSKAQVSLMAVRKHFPQAKIFAVYEPNVGNRTISSQKFYSHVFNQADYLIIPRLSKTKTDAHQEKRMDGQELANIIRQKNKETKVLYLEDDDKLVDFLVNEVKPKDVVIFLGSHGFRGMIEQTITCLRQSPQG